MKQRATNRCVCLVDASQLAAHAAPERTAAKTLRTRFVRPIVRRIRCGVTDCHSRGPQLLCLWHEGHPSPPHPSHSALRNRPAVVLLSERLLAPEARRKSLESQNCEIPERCACCGASGTVESVTRLRFSARF